MGRRHSPRRLRPLRQCLPRSCLSPLLLSLNLTGCLVQFSKLIDQEQRRSRRAERGTLSVGVAALPASLHPSRTSHAGVPKPLPSHGLGNRLRLISTGDAGLSVFGNAPFSLSSFFCNHLNALIVSSLWDSHCLFKHPSLSYCSYYITF